MTVTSSWPPALAGTPAVSVLENAIAKQRLSHSLLLHGDDLETLTATALAIADRLLNPPGANSPFSPEQHPDCFHLRPAGKARQISADATRELIGKVQVTASMEGRKVAIIHEADRMHAAAANIFLKTLEEPPAHTTLILITTRPHSLLPTIRSRVLHFRLPSTGGSFRPAGFAEWLADYDAWLARLTKGVGGKREVAEPILTLYGLIARFSKIIDTAVASAWEQLKPGLPAELEDEEQIAIETGLANGIRSRLFAEIAHATRAFALARLQQGDEHARRSLIDAVRKLEHGTGLLRVNLNEAAVLEDFLLSSLRIWTRA